MSNECKANNSVNEPEGSIEGPLPGYCLIGRQDEPGCHLTAGQQEENDLKERTD